MTIGWKTLDAGEQALVYNHEGSARIEDGPNRLFLWREKFVLLERFSADQKQYLIICYRDGRVEHRKGPSVIFKNPIAHKDIKLMSMKSLDANEALVIYRQDEHTKAVSRYIQFGPTLFTPQANEWMHSFSWHGTDPDNKTRVRPGLNEFQVLKVIPDQIYYNVDEVRLKDDAAIKVKLMLFYELKDIDTMLNATRDPIADFINCVCADVIAFAAQYTYVEFMEKASKLNDMANYPQLMERCKSIGYVMSKVVYRGYHAHDKLQKLHDNAVKTRTNLKIMYEKEETEQNMTDVELHNKRDRKAMEQKLEIQSLEHKYAMQKAKIEHDLALGEKREEEKNKQWRNNEQALLQGTKVENQQKIEHYEKLKSLGVDLNEVFRMQSSRPEKVVRVIADKGANFHLHHS